MNKNNKGFMLLETLIVSTIILSTLIFLFVQFSNIKTSYEISFTHNTIPGIYIAKELSDFLVTSGNNTKLDTKLKNVENGFINITTHTDITYGEVQFYEKMIENMKIKQIIYTSNENLATLKSYLNSDKVNKNVFTESFKNFIFKIKVNENNQSYNRLIIMFKDNTFASIVIGGA